MATYSWDVAKPADGDNISIGAGQIRTDKVTVRDALQDFTDFPNNPTALLEGAARITHATMASRPAAAVEGKAFCPSDERIIQVDSGSAWLTRGYCGPMTRKMLDYIMRETGDVGWNVDATSWATINSELYLLADAINIDTSNNALGDAPKARLVVVGKLIDAAAVLGVRLYNSSLASDVAGSSVALTYSDAFVHRYLSAEFSLDLGDYNYKLQAQRTGGTAAQSAIMDVLLELIPA